MNSKISHEQMEYLRIRFESIVSASNSKKYVHTLTHSGYRYMDPNQPMAMGDAVMHTEPVYNLEIPEHQLIQLIECMQAYEDQMLMADRYPAVREAWMNLRTLMMLIKH